MKIWIAHFTGEGTTNLTFHKDEIGALCAGASMMTAEYCQPGNACEGDDPVEFRFIRNYGGTVGLTKIIWITDGFFPGAPEVSIYEREVK